MKCPIKFNKLIEQKNKCIDECYKDDIYKYEYNFSCYEHCPNGINSSNYICLDIINEKEKIESEKEVLNDIYLSEINNIYFSDYKLMEEEDTVKKLRSYIKKGIIVENLLEGKDDFIQEDGNVTYQITTSERQKNNINYNISSINLGTCEKILKDTYKIDKELPLIVFKIDYYTPDTKIPMVGYEIYHPKNKTKLDLSYCEEILIKLNIPTSIDEDYLFKYDPNSGFYTDNCFSFTTDEGTDIILTDRKKEFETNNLSLCQNNCEYIDYNKNNKQSSCECDIKNEMDTISKISNNPDKLSKAFNVNETNSFSSSNIITMKCTKNLFSKDGLINNIASYILFIFLFIFLLCIILFIKCGFPLLEQDINDILNSKKKDKRAKNKQTSSNNNKNIISNRKNDFPPKKRKLNPFNLISNNLNLQRENKSKNVNSKYNFFKRDKEISLNLNNNDYSDNKIDDEKKNNSKRNKKRKKRKIKRNENNNKISNNQNKEKEKLNLNDFEINTLKYSYALSYDKRNFFHYYISLLKTKHPILFSFCPIKDYNLIIIKLCISCLSFSLYYSINYIFFNEKMIHKIYEDKGNYNFVYFFPKILIAFIISQILTIFLRFIFLSERNIIQIRKQSTYSKAYDIVPTVKKQLTIKYIIFFILGLLILVFFWMLLSSFGAVFQNSQVIVIENTLISFGISFIYPFIINIFPCLFRICSFNSKSEYLYKFSNVLQIL